MPLVSFSNGLRNTEPQVPWIGYPSSTILNSRRCPFTGIGAVGWECRQSGFFCKPIVKGRNIVCCRPVLLAVAVLLISCATPQYRNSVDEQTLTWIIQFCKSNYPTDATEEAECVKQLHSAALKGQAKRASRERTPRPSAFSDYGSKVYEAGECIGPVIMGKCHGSILPKKAYHPRCYGTWLNGQCTGPMF